MRPTLRVLVACEMSGRVRRAFQDRGWDAWSADILPSEEPDYGNRQHYEGDCRDLFSWLHPVNQERARDVLHAPADVSYPLWDLIICHPPCDHLSYAGARWFKQKQADGRQAQAATFFMEMVNAPSPLVAVENPHSIMQM